MITKDIGVGTPLVLIHGFAVNSLIMQSLEEYIDFSGWRRIYVDLPWTKLGLDNSVKSSDDILRTLEQEIHEYLGEERFALVGNSFGAMIARGIAHNNQEKVLGLATLAGVFEPISEQRKLPEKSVIIQDSAFISSLTSDKEDFSDISVIQDKPNYQRFVKYVLPGLTEANAEVMNTVSKKYGLSQVPEETTVGLFEAPSLHLFGRQDHVVGYEDGLQWVGHYKRGTFVVLDQAGHNLHLEQPQLVKPLFENWLLSMRFNG